MKKNALFLVALIAGGTISQAQARVEIPEIFRRTIDMEKVSEAAAVVAAQCLEILKKYGTKGIEIVKSIIQQVPELADQIRVMLKNAGYPV